MNIGTKISYLDKTKFLVNTSDFPSLFELNMNNAYDHIFYTKPVQIC